jgi:signal transduction histidine kinase
VKRYEGVLFVGLIGLGALGIIAGVAYSFAAGDRYGHVDSLLWIALGVGPVYGTGVFAYLKRPDHPTTRRLLITGSFWAFTIWPEYFVVSLHGQSGAAVPIALGMLVLRTSTLISVVAGAALFGLFPDGRYERRFERRALRGLWALLVVPVLGLASAPTTTYPEYDVLGEIANPFGLTILSPVGAVSGVLYQLSWLAFLVGPVLLVLRYRRASSERRLQIKWILFWALLITMVLVADVLLRLVGVIPDVLSSRVVGWLTIALIAVFPFVVLVGLFRHRLLDIDLLVRKSLVYSVLWVLIALAYVGAAAALGIAASSRLPVALAVLLTMAAAMLFQPVRRRLERLADRWLFGERMTGYQLLSRFGDALEGTVDLEELLPRLAETVRRGLGLTWARVSLWFPGGPSSAAATASGIDPGSAATPEMTMPLSHRGDRLGTIECGPKTEGAFSEQDRELLAQVARQAAMGIRNVRMAAELSGRLQEIRLQAAELGASRARLAQAQEAERRRIERNIHDGVQQEVVALMAKARLARNQLRRDPGLAEATLGELQGEAARVLDGIRELAQGIHPTVLSDRGLVEAAEDRAGRMPIPVTVRADAVLREHRYAEEIEGAAYFLISEGLANVVKHAGARTVEVSLELRNGALLVGVRDDGAGFEPKRSSGTGLANLADRIAALGGRLEVVSRPSEGTRLTGELPAREAGHA